VVEAHKFSWCARASSAVPQPAIVRVLHTTKRLGRRAKIIDPASQAQLKQAIAEYVLSNKGVLELLRREHQTRAQHDAGLADNYTVCHGVHWTHVERGSYATFGEIDFAIVGPTGKIVLI
jgi:hypothetical protein